MVRQLRVDRRSTRIALRAAGCGGKVMTVSAWPAHRETIDPFHSVQRFDSRKAKASNESAHGSDVTRTAWRDWP
jgi:hypothetical protein